MRRVRPTACAVAVAIALALGAAPAAAEGILLEVSVSREQMEDFGRALAAVPGVSAISSVSRVTVDFVRTRDAAGAIVDAAPSGFRYSLDAMLFDPASAASLAGGLPAVDLASLGEGEAVLSETSVLVRRLGPGATVELVDGSVLTIRGVVPDALIQNREIAIATLSLAGGEGRSRPRFLFRYEGPEDTLEARLEALVPEDSRLRLRAQEPSDYIRSGAPILPQAAMKLALGEFAFKPTDGRYFERDPPLGVEEPGQRRCSLAWSHAVPSPGCGGGHRRHAGSDRRRSRIPCGRRRVPGCDNPRRISEGRGFSRHAWGGAVTSTTAATPTSARSPPIPASSRSWSGGVHVRPPVAQPRPGPLRIQERPATHPGGCRALARPAGAARGAPAPHYPFVNHDGAITMVCLSLRGLPECGSRYKMKCCDTGYPLVVETGWGVGGGAVAGGRGAGGPGGLKGLRRRRANRRGPGAGGSRCAAHPIGAPGFGGLHRRGGRRAWRGHGHRHPRFPVALRPRR